MGTFGRWLANAVMVSAATIVISGAVFGATKAVDSVAFLAGMENRDVLLLLTAQWTVLACAALIVAGAVWTVSKWHAKQLDDRVAKEEMLLSEIKALHEDIVARQRYTAPPRTEDIQRTSSPELRSP